MTSLVDGEGLVSDNDLRPRIVSEEQGAPSLQLLLAAELTPGIHPVLVEGHVGRVGGGQAGVGDGHAVADDVEGVGQGRGEERGQVVRVHPHALWWSAGMVTIKVSRQVLRKTGIKSRPFPC